MFKIIFVLAGLLMLGACGGTTTTITTVRYDTVTNPGIEHRHARAAQHISLPVERWRRYHDRNGVESMLTRYYSDYVRWNCKGTAAATYCTRGYPYGQATLHCRKQPLAGTTTRRKAAIAELVYICRQVDQVRRPHRYYRAPRWPY